MGLRLLVKALADHNDEVRSTAGSALGIIGSPAVPALINYLADQNDTVRANVAWALGRIGSPAADSASQNAWWML